MLKKLSRLVFQAAVVCKIVSLSISATFSVCVPCCCFALPVSLYPYMILSFV